MEAKETSNSIRISADAYRTLKTMHTRTGASMKWIVDGLIRDYKRLNGVRTEIDTLIDKHHDSPAILDDLKRLKGKVS